MTVSDDQLSVVHACVAGRARLRVAGLKRSPTLRRRLEAAAKPIAIRQVAPSELTGTVLVLYDARTLTMSGERFTGERVA